MIPPNSQNNGENEDDYAKMLKLFYNYGIDHDDNLYRETQEETDKLVRELTGGRALKDFNRNELRGYQEAKASLDEWFELHNHHDSDDE